MPRFFFDIQDRDGCHRDEAGDEFDDLAQAQDQARALLSDIARWQSFESGQETLACCVRDSEGEVIYRGELIYRGTVPDAGRSRPWSGTMTPC